MKKRSIIIATMLALLVAIGAFGLAFAQTNAPPSPETPYGRGRMGMVRWGENAASMLGGFRGNAPAGAEGPLHEYLLPALAEAFNLTPDELEARHASGDTLWELAEARGFTSEQFQELVQQARSEALNQAVVEGVISQEQADWMLSRMSRGWAAGYGPGSGLCDGSGPQGGGHQFGSMHRYTQP